MFEGHHLKYLWAICGHSSIGFLSVEMFSYIYMWNKKSHTWFLEVTRPIFSISNFLAEQCWPNTTIKKLSLAFKEHLLVLMFPRHKVTSASLPACLLLFVQKSTEGRAHWRQRWCHHCDHYCAVWCPIFDQASLKAGQNVCLHTARRNSGLSVLINTRPVFFRPKTVLRPPPQAHLSLCSDALQLTDHSNLTTVCGSVVTYIFLSVVLFHWLSTAIKYLIYSICIDHVPFSIDTCVSCLT